MEFQKILVVVISIFGVLMLVSLIGFCVYNLYNTLAPSWGLSGYSTCGGSSFSDVPNINGACTKFKDNYEMTVTINNYNKEIKDVKCEFVSKGGMASDKDQISLPFISSNSSDVCDFVLTGQPTGSTLVRVTYSKKGFWGYKNFSTIVTSYPDCSTAIDASTLPQAN